MDDPIINHTEARELAALKRNESNLARCYLAATDEIERLRAAMREAIDNIEVGRQFRAQEELGDALELTL